MITANLRKVGGSTIVAIPPAVLDQLGLGSDTKVTLSIEGERLVIEKRRRPKYTLDELLAQCDFTIPMSDEEREWLDMPAVGREIVE